MGDTLTREEQYLLKEYDTAVALTYHIDDMRNKLTSFYLIFSGVAVSGVAFILKSEIKPESSPLIKNGEILVTILLLVVSVLGLITVLGLARLRKVQIEHFQIIANIRNKFIGDNLTDVVPLTKNTVPVPSKTSGSYMWLLLVMITSSCLFGFFMYLFATLMFPQSDEYVKWFVTGISAIIFFKIQDASYFKWAKYVYPTV